MSHEPITSCEQAIQLLAQYLDRELDETRYESLEDHLRKCRSCYSRAEFERRLKAELGRLRREDIRPAFERRIRELITQFAPGAADPPQDG
jgi:hypothetical protein